MTRVLLAYPGGELSLFTYKKPVPPHLLTKKMASLASTLFDSWEWSVDSTIPVIEDVENERVIMAVEGPSGKECIL